MKLFKYLLCIFPLIFMVNLFAQTPNPRPPRTTWVKELKYIQDGTMTFTYKTLTSPVIVSPTFSGTATGPFDGSAAITAAAGDRALQWYAIQSDTLTGTAVTYYGRTTGGDSSGAGTLRGAEIGARVTDTAGMVASVVTGGYFWADAKARTATTLRGLEVSLDGSAGGTSTLASGIVIFNNSSATQTSSYAVDINEGNPSGRKAFTADMRMQNGATFDNAANNVFEWNENSDELKWTFGSNTITASSTDVTLFDYGSIDLATDALDLSDGNILNVGTIALDGINPDGTVIGNTGIWAWTSDGDSLILNLYKSTEMLELKTGATTVFKVDSTGLLTVANGINLGTSKSIVGTTSLTVGAGTETVAINSSDWDIDATGAMTGIGNITSNGTITDGTYSSTAGVFTGVASLTTKVLAAADAALTASTGRLITAFGTMNNATLGDGYGMVEIDGTLTGTSTGHVAAASAWINIPSGTAAALNYVTPLNIGVYEDAAATITNAKIVFGARMQHILGDTDALTFPFSLNTDNKGITALFDVNTNTDLGIVTNAGTDNGTLVPLARDVNGNIIYVKIYTLL